MYVPFFATRSSFCWKFHKLCSKIAGQSSAVPFQHWVFCYLFTHSLGSYCSVCYTMRNIAGDVLCYCSFGPLMTANLERSFLKLFLSLGGHKNDALLNCARFFIDFTAASRWVVDWLYGNYLMTAKKYLLSEFWQIYEV